MANRCDSGAMIELRLENYRVPYLIIEVPVSTRRILLQPPQAVDATESGCGMPLGEGFRLYVIIERRKNCRVILIAIGPVRSHVFWGSHLDYMRTGFCLSRLFMAIFPFSVCRLTLSTSSFPEMRAVISHE